MGGGVRKNPMDWQAQADALRALADPTRLRIISLVRAAGDLTVSELTNSLASVSQPTVSHHLGVLAHAGVLHRAKRGMWVHYTLDEDRLRVITGLVGGQLS